MQLTVDPLNLAQPVFNARDSCDKWKLPFLSCLTFASGQRRPFVVVDVSFIQAEGFFENGLILIVACLIVINSISQVFEWPFNLVGIEDQV